MPALSFYAERNTANLNSYTRVTATGRILSSRSAAYILDTRAALSAPSRARHRLTQSYPLDPRCRVLSRLPLRHWSETLSLGRRAIVAFYPTPPCISRDRGFFVCAMALRSI